MLPQAEKMAEADHERYQQTAEPHGRKKSGNLCGDGKPGERNDRAQIVWLDNENQRKRQIKRRQKKRRPQIRQEPSSTPNETEIAFRLSQAAETAMRVRPPGRAESGRKSRNPSKQRNCAPPEIPAEIPSRYRTGRRAVQSAVRPLKRR